MSVKSSSHLASRWDRPNKQEVSQIKNSKDSDYSCVIRNDEELLWTLLNEQREQPELCDVTLTVGDRHLHAHKVVLMANIPYFKVMFESGMKEAKSNQIEIKDIDFECLEMVIDYVYGQEIKITAEFFLGLVFAADFYLMPNLLKTCVAVFPRVFTEDFDVGQLLPLHSSCQLNDELEHIGPIEDAIMDNFVAVSMHPNFPKLPFETIFRFCKADALTVKGEKEVLQVICRWLNGNLDRDCCDVRKLLECVRVPLSVTFTCTIFTVSDEPKYFNDVLALIHRASILKFDERYFTVLNNGAREPVGTTIIFPSISEYTPNNYVYSYSICNRRCTKLTLFPKEHYSKVAFISGGQVCWYDRETHNFVYRSFTSSSLKVHQKTINHSPARFDRFAKGGNYPKAISNGKSWIFGNVHDKILTLWKEDSTLCTSIKGIGSDSVLVYLDEAVYIIGSVSKNPAGFEICKVLMVKAEDVSVKEEVQPVYKAPMIHVRDSPSVVAFKGKIYVCGGICANGYQESGEVYDPQTNR